MRMNRKMKVRRVSKIEVSIGNKDQDFDTKIESLYHPPLDDLRRNYDYTRKVNNLQSNLKCDMLKFTPFVG